MDIKLRFINKTNDAGNTDFVIFQKNVAIDFDELAVAWTVIQHCGQGDYHPFLFPLAITANVSDSYGNYTPEIPAENGSMYHVVGTPSGHVFAYAGPATSAKAIEIRNDLVQGAIGCNLYKDGRLLATKTGVAPGQKAVFEFKPTIWIGAVSQIQEGQLMNSALLSAINTEISLLGIASADIVATGGGALPFAFSLENVVYA